MCVCAVLSQEANVRANVSFTYYPIDLSRRRETGVDETKRQVSGYTPIYTIDALSMGVNKESYNNRAQKCIHVIQSINVKRRQQDYITTYIKQPCV